MIKEEARRLPHSKNEYNVIENENLMDACSETLMTLLSKLSQNFEKSLPAVMIGNIVTSAVTKRLQNCNWLFQFLQVIGN